MAVNGKAKGSEYERKVAKILGAWWKEDFHRVPMSGGLGWSRDSRVTGDIVPPPNSTFPFSIECKKQEDWEFHLIFKSTDSLIDKYWLQSTKDAEKVSKIPVVIFSKNRMPNYIMMSEKVFSQLPTTEGITHWKVTKRPYNDRVICILEDFIQAVSKESVEHTFKRI